MDYYTKIWNLGLSKGKFQNCNLALFELIYNTLNEFLVTRHKALIFLNMGFNLTTPPENIELLNDSNLKLKKVIMEAAKRKISIQDAWGELTTVVYRYLFYPLARSSAYQLSNPNFQHPYSPAKSDFYSAHIQVYWQQMETEMNNLYITEFEGLQASFEFMISTTENLLAYLGVFLQPSIIGDVDPCYATFSNHFFKERDNL